MDTFCKYYDYELDDGLIVDQPGVYQSIYTNTQNCDSIIEVNLIEKNCTPCTVFFPTAFTPNVDGKNEKFARAGTCSFTKYQLSIFNRWGELLFYTEDPEKGWDGIFNGKKAQQGVCFYSCYYINNEEKAENIYGDITILK